MNAPSRSALYHLKFRQLVLIDRLVELGTLHKAARALNVSQPAATAMLSDLEATFGFRLFDRSHRGVRPTANGQRMLDSVRTLLHEFHAFAETVQRVGEGRERMLRMGVVPQAFATYLPRTIERFRALGGCAVKTQEGTAMQLLGLLWDGHLDGVIGRLPSAGLPDGMDAARLRFENLYAESICIVAGNHPAIPDPLPNDCEGLARQPWVLQRRDSSVRQALNAAFLRQGLQPPTPVVETTNYLQSLLLVAHAGYFTIAPRSPSLRQQEAGAVRILEIDLDLPPMQVSFICRSASDENAQLNLFRESFRAVVQAEGRVDSR